MEYSAIEQYLLLRIGLCIDPNAFESAGVVPRVLRDLGIASASTDASHRIREAKRSQIIDELLTADDVPENSIYPNFDEKWGRPSAEQNAIRISKRSVDRLFTKIVKGMLYLETGRFVEPPLAITLFPMRDEQANPFLDVLNKFGKSLARPPGIVVRFATAHEDGISSIFEITIWGQFSTYAVVNCPSKDN